MERRIRFDFPIIAMYGDHSPARLSGAELLAIWPHAEFLRVRDAGHFFPTLRPQEVLSACLRFWGGEFAAAPRRYRRGEARRSHFRSYCRNSNRSCGLTRLSRCLYDSYCSYLSACRLSLCCSFRCGARVQRLLLVARACHLCSLLSRSSLGRVRC